MRDEDLLDMPGDLTQGELRERELWADYEFERQQKIVGRRVNIACGTLVALIFSFNAWLVWLIWFGI